MVDRRTILKLGAAGAASAIINISSTALGAIGPDYSRSPLTRAIFDGRSVEGLAFASEMDAGGVAISEIGIGLAELWYGDLQARLRNSPVPIAGLTDRTALFCLEELVRSVGMRVRYRIDHKLSPTGQLWHDAAGPASIVEAATRLDNRSGYGRAIAVLARKFDPRESFGTDAQKRTGPFSPENGPALVSWVIA